MAHQVMESNAAGLVLRPALKTGFSEMGWGSTPLLSAKLWKMCCKVRQEFAKLSFRNGLTGSIPVSSAKIASVMELVYVPDLKSGFCGFESRHSHQVFTALV